MSKLATQPQLAEIAQVSEAEIKNLAKLLATEVLGIHPAEWSKMTNKYGSLFRKKPKRINAEVT
jgi:predicted urease superfamily metal-dependent hydrolase